jgi:hypothetical protein
MDKVQIPSKPEHFNLFYYKRRKVAGSIPDEFTEFFN